MPKKQKELQQQATQRSDQQYAVGQQAQQRLIEGTPEMKADQQRVAERVATRNSGDYSNAKDFFSNKDRLAEQKRERDNVLSLNPTGASAIAMQYANPTQIALSQKIADDEFARDQTAQTEQDIRDYNSQTDAMEQNIINRQIGINSDIMGTGFSQANINQDRAAQIAAQRASFLSNMVGMALGGFSSLATGGASNLLSIGSKTAQTGAGFARQLAMTPANAITTQTPALAGGYTARSLR